MVYRPRHLLLRRLANLTRAWPSPQGMRNESLSIWACPGFYLAMCCRGAVLVPSSPVSLREAGESQRRQLSREELIAHVFDILDGDGDGKLNRDELRRCPGPHGVRGGGAFSPRCALGQPLGWATQERRLRPGSATLWRRFHGSGAAAHCGYGTAREASSLLRVAQLRRYVAEPVDRGCLGGRSTWWPSNICTTCCEVGSGGAEAVGVSAES